MSLEKIPLCTPNLGEGEFKAVEDVLKSGWLTHGPKTKEFEDMFAAYVGVDHAIAMNSCTSALFLAILTHEITGDVLVPSFTFVASANAIVTAGATPVFCEINYHDCNVDTDLLENYLTPQTQAIMIVHYAGQCCDMEKITAFCAKHDLVLIEDSAETIGGLFKNKMAGSWGTGCFSFFPTKNITTGEGGMLTTSDAELARKVRTLIAHGIDKSTMERHAANRSWARTAILPGYNFRLSNLLAAIGVEQMKRVDDMNDQRRIKSRRLIENLKDMQMIDLPIENPDCHHVYQMFTVKCGNGVARDDVVIKLKEKGIEASVHFDPPVHKHAAYENVATGDLSVTEKVAENILTLPMFPHLPDSSIDRISEELTKILKNV